MRPGQNHKAKAWAVLKVHNVLVEDLEDPTVEGGQWLVERAAEVGQLLQRCRLDVLGVEVPGDQAVTLSPPQRVGQDLVGDALDAVVEVLVATATASVAWR
jgi:hypothetical protein